MAASQIEVRVHGRGSVRGGEPTANAQIEARCDLCGGMTDAVVSVTKDASAPFACKSCLRERLESVTVALYLLGEQKQGLPWGKISG
jgi:hypothetical protein